MAARKSDLDAHPPAALIVRAWPQFRRDLIHHARHPDMDRETLAHCVEHLATGETLEGPGEFRDHPLENRARKWAGYREFHLGADLLVIYRRLSDSLVLCRIGTHTKLFTPLNH